MKQKRLNSLCFFMSTIALLFVLFLYFQKSYEGLENKSENKSILASGTDWRIEEVLPGEEKIKKAQKAGEKIDMENIPKNLAIMFKSGQKWKKKFILRSDGIMEGVKFESKK